MISMNVQPNRAEQYFFFLQKFRVRSLDKNGQGENLLGKSHNSYPESKQTGTRGGALTGSRSIWLKTRAISAFMDIELRRDLDLLLIPVSIYSF